MMPHASGGRDDPSLPSPTRPRARRRLGAVRVEVGPRYTSHLYGARLVPILDELGIPHMRDPFRGNTLCCPTNRLDDLLACLEYRDHRYVEVVAVDR